MTELDHVDVQLSNAIFIARNGKRIASHTLVSRRIWFGPWWKKVASNTASSVWASDEGFVPCR